MKGEHCIRAGINDIFALKDPLGKFIYDLLTQFYLNIMQWSILTSRRLELVWNVRSRSFVLVRSAPVAQFARQLAAAPKHPRIRMQKWKRFWALEMKTTGRYSRD